MEEGETGEEGEWDEVQDVGEKESRDTRGGSEGKGGTAGSVMQYCIIFCGTCHMASLMDKSSSGAQHTVWHVHVHIHIITYCIPFSRFSTTVNAKQSPPHYTHFQSPVLCQLTQHQNQQ